MTRPKPKTVRAWCFAVTNGMNSTYVMDVHETRKDALCRRKWVRRCGYTVGPVVRIEVPAPKERKPRG